MTQRNAIEDVLTEEPMNEPLNGSGSRPASTSKNELENGQENAAAFASAASGKLLDHPPLPRSGPETAVICIYERISTLTAEMLAAARDGDWDLLAALEERCSECVHHLEDCGHDGPLKGQARETKVRLLNKILADDREIRNLTEPWLARLSAMIASGASERRLSEAYDSERFE